IVFCGCYIGVGTAGSTENHPRDPRHFWPVNRLGTASYRQNEGRGSDDGSAALVSLALLTRRSGTSLTSGRRNTRRLDHRSVECQRVRTRETTQRKLDEPRHISAIQQRARQHGTGSADLLTNLHSRHLLPLLAAPSCRVRP